MKPALPARRERGGKAGGRRESLKEVKKEKKEVGTVGGTRKEGTGMGPRKSRSKERTRSNNSGPSEVFSIQMAAHYQYATEKKMVRQLNENDRLILFLTQQRQSLSDYERIKEREKELERIHRRSRSFIFC